MLIERLLSTAALKHFAGSQDSLTKHMLFCLAIGTGVSRTSHRCCNTLTKMLHALSTLSTYLPTIVGSRRLVCYAGAKVSRSMWSAVLVLLHSTIQCQRYIFFQKSHRTAVSAASSPDREIPWVIRTCDQPTHDGNQLGLYHFKRHSHDILLREIIFQDIIVRCQRHFTFIRHNNATVIARNFS
jgi:hypothetical protein